MNETYFIILISLLYFFIGTLVVLFRRDTIIMLMGLELMLNSANFFLITVGNVVDNLEGQIFALLVLAIAACEVALGLAIVVNLFRLRQTTNIDQFHSLRSK
ncbi:MAG: NADH-quinone oxidoreductase subunit NuoK [candidate division WOR-3 bacterium]|nr:NADH-quinone oxidoreductase subunit NuoK [candidate division WOR-3 bacterium]MCX7947195.1 NADH-quinone oxidoreductase subunit NuoK [candidate division WOR-3 bacterium]MDW8150251.1 NADH-quinone oxidoreductase subunit NuoK [candidate division WOR-3 bacterium]